MQPNSLGVLVTSEKHADHLLPLLRAAKRKHIAVAVHLQGDGVRLCMDERCQKVLDQVPFSICRNSAESLGVADEIQARYPQVFAPDTAFPSVIGACSKQLVL